jgi:hypothetical protein
MENNMIDIDNLSREELLEYIINQRKKIQNVIRNIERIIQNHLKNHFKNITTKLKTMMILKQKG